MNKLFTLFIAFNLLSLTIVQAVENSTAQLKSSESLQIQNSKKQAEDYSVWRIYNKKSGGTGFFISPNLFITNFHVLENLLEETQKLNEIHLSQEGNSNILNIEKLISLSALHDLALIKTKESSQHYLTLNEGLTKNHENLLLIGYPDGVFTIINQTEKINRENDHSFSFSVNYSQLLAASGSPILNSEAEVVGVFYRKINNMAFGIKLNHLKSFIAGDTGLNCESIKLKDCFKKETDKLKLLAKKGNPIAQNTIALNHYNSKNYKEAYYWYKKSAEQGDADAQLHLGLMYDEAKGISQDYKIALEWYKKSAEQGQPIAQYNLGLMYHKAKGVPQNYEEAFKWFQKAAKQGDTNAQFKLGEMYYKGKGVSQDNKIAFKWFEKSAKQGDTDAQVRLGLMYYQGKGVPQNYEQAFKWFEISAEEGDTNAQFNLAVMYEQGKGGVSQDNQMAFYWYEISAEQGNPKAIEWMKKVAEQGNPKAQFRLGMMYYNGEGVLQNYKQAGYWLEKTAEQGHTIAQYNLGVMNYRAEGVPKNYKKAFKWFQKLAEQGIAEAQNNLGVMYYRGQGVPQNYEEAFKWFQKAAEQKVPEAQEKLALMYKKGIGTKQNLELADHWLKKFQSKQNIPIIKCSSVFKE